MARPVNTEKLTSEYTVTAAELVEAKNDLKTALISNDRKAWDEATETIRSLREEIFALSRFHTFMLDNMAGKIGADNIIGAEPINGRRETKTKDVDYMDLLAKM